MLINADIAIQVMLKEFAHPGHMLIFKRISSLNILIAYIKILKRSIY